MPRSSRYGSSSADELPLTLLRSSPEAQVLFREAREEAVRAHVDRDEANRAAYAAPKQKFEKRGDCWIAKAEPAACSSEELVISASRRPACIPGIAARVIGHGQLGAASRRKTDTTSKASPMGWFASWS